MDTKKDPQENSISDYIDDNEYYQYRKDKEQVENVTWAIYIFAVLAVLFYVIYLMMNTEYFDLVNFGINALAIIAYFCLGAYCKHKPFTTIIATFSLLVFFFLADIFLTDSINLRGIVVKVGFIVYIAMRLEAAKRVQDYENKQLKEIKK